ncbi:wall-associated receptor kinase 2-like isoform X3 [Carya illinoinensis]|nr:wall-associated receptor kinase 2-like isoform X3 [Carya illinoinensis]XP_042961652.1 wall-associated receptor kinase 2-like isoform X3 [Carya illinoinensis]XP_042961653.1 wall-associated receptor kinase 2-like isoform X3 [Carya illinoinensis]XP_042961654.1 wall-associated receptor kinase 2-like isoform X3 [Carya illinoinensis]XP_042961655.1 wall-associated receptor kinase 2-like isoform X3 [Carya illinoinensis]XP_042961656.1 wall-associated receptor kinase 2-like isoform X3 [Carya illinoin
MLNEKGSAFLFCFVFENRPQAQKREEAAVLSTGHTCLRARNILLANLKSLFVSLFYKRELQRKTSFFGSTDQTRKRSAMALHGKLLEQLVVLLHLIIGVQLVLSSAPQPNDPSCIRKCGSVDIPYPFGTRKGCYLDQSFLIICNDSFQPAKPFLGVDHNIDVLNISLDGELRVSNLVFRRCQWWPEFDNQPSLRRISALLNLSNFSISIEKNSIFAVGCNFYAYISGSHEQDYKFMSGCISFCGNSSGLVNGSCSGLGCCHSAIPGNTTNYNLTVQSIYTNGSSRTSGQSCGLGFIGETQAYNFSTLDFTNLTKRETVPLVLDWALGNKKCKDAEKNMTSYLCKAANSSCSEPHGRGYICKCPDGYKGNPYLSDEHKDSCQDIDECKDRNPCNATATCTNTNGSYTCICRNGYEGDGKMPPGTGCSRKGQSKIMIIALGISISLLILLVGTLLVYWVMQRRKLTKLKENFFQQNGGLILQRQLLNHKELVEPAKIFSAKELEKATNNYDKSRVLGQGGFGTVYKGVLSDDKVVAIKKSNVVDQSQIEQFINEVVVLSKINHKNVVKLLGCCLETEVPLLVYEFITNGTLFDHIHDKNLSSSLSWEKRLKVASETAGALAYIHFETSMSIIHRDVKTTNILLDDNHTAKVSDFGASRLVPLDHTRLTTVVQGTLGYLDPEYFHTSQLTEKSDVYSFGVVIAELLTGEKALSMDRPETERNLAMHFVIAMKEDRLLQIIDDRILTEGNIEEIKEVANIAKKCLKVRGEDRPSMQQVTKELEGLRLLEKHSLKRVDPNTQQITKPLPNAPTHSSGIDVDIGSSSMSTIVADDSMKNQILKPTDNDAR